MDNLEDCCRLCLGTDNVNVPLFASRFGKEPYSVQIDDMFGIKLHKTPKWPFIACRGCVWLLNEVRELREKILTTQERLEVLSPTTDVECPLRSEPGKDKPPGDEKPSVSRRSTRSRPLPYNIESVVIKKKTESNSEEDEEDSMNESEPNWEPPSAENTLHDPDDPQSVEKEAKVSPKATLKSSSPPKQRGRPALDHPYDSTMHEMGLLFCHLCFEEFDKYASLTRHCGAKHKKLPKITCCNRVFPKAQLADHMRYHQDQTTFRCQPCAKNLLSGELLTRHNASKHQMGDSQHQCELCDHKFRAPNLLKIHMIKHTKQSEREVFSCQHCDKVFNYQTSLKAHITRHHEEDLKEICEVCGRGFASKWLLSEHRKSHNPRTTEQCDECLMYFANIKMHKKKMHTNLELVECRECHKMISPSYYKLHVKQYHGERKELPCEVCGKIFHNQKNLKVHMGLHLGVSYTCRFCPMTFNIMGNRSKHEYRIHAEEYTVWKANQDEEKKRPPIGSIVEIIVVDEDEC